MRVPLSWLRDYVAITAYIRRSAENEEALRQVRVRLRDRYKVATTVGFGPRFLHSTGQLHKGGPNTGLFIQVVSGDEADLEVPGKPYTFGTLKAAQALTFDRAVELGSTNGTAKADMPAREAAE